MANVKAKIDVVQSLSDLEKRVLYAIYSHRCLDEELIHDFFYALEGHDEEYTATKIDYMIKCDLICEVVYGGDQPALFLTTAGVSTIRYIFDIPTETWNERTGKLRPSLKTAKDLRIAPLKIRHQIHLNHFVLSFEKRAQEEHLVYRYYDETFTGFFQTVQPDGIIQLNNCDIYLEMDMATERAEKLISKWSHYRAYMKTKEFLYAEKPIIVLFITSNVKRLRMRRDTVLSTLNHNLLDMVDDRFQFFIGDFSNMLQLIFDRYISADPHLERAVNSVNRILSKMHGFTSSTGYLFQAITRDLHFDMYSRQLNERKNIVVKNGKAQEFFIDLFVNEPVSILKKIVFFDAINSEVKMKAGREIPYLVMVDNIDHLYRDLSILDARAVPNVYFSTIKRMKTMSLPDAIFQFNSMGDMFHFSDNSLSIPVFERKIRI